MPKEPPYAPGRRGSAPDKSGQHRRVVTELRGLSVARLWLLPPPMPTTRLSATLLLAAAIGCGAPEAPETTSAAVLPAPEFLSQLQSARARNDVLAYRTATRRALAEGHRLTPKLCVERQTQLLDYTAAHGMDGLEGLWLFYQDCASALRTSNAQSLRNAQRFAAAATFRSALKPAFLQGVARWNGRTERSTRESALRAMIKAATSIDAKSLQFLSATKLLEQPKVASALCAGPFDVGTAARPNLGSLAALGACLVVGRPSGLGAYDALCGEVEAQNAATRASSAPGMSTVPPRSSPLNQMRGDQLSSLGTFCAQRSAGAAGSTSLDALDAASVSNCLDPVPASPEIGADLADKIVECYGVGGSASSALADNGDTADAGTKPGALRFDWPVEGSKIELTWITNRDGDHIMFYSEKGNEEAWQQAFAEHCQPPTHCAWDDATYDEFKKLEDAQNANKPVNPSPSPSASPSPSPTPSPSTAPSPSPSTTPPAPEEEEEELSLDGVPHRTFDPNNPACQDLARSGLVNGRRDSTIWDAIFGRAAFEKDPRLEKPVPTDGSTVDESIQCNEGGAGPGTGGRCNAAVTCLAGAVPNDNCQCTAARDGRGAPTGLSCYATYCAEGVATPIGAAGCVCMTDTTAPTLGAPPAPNPGVEQVLLLEHLSRPQ